MVTPIGRRKSEVEGVISFCSRPSGVVVGILVISSHVRTKVSFKSSI